MKKNVIRKIISGLLCLLSSLFFASLLGEGLRSYNSSKLEDFWPSRIIHNQISDKLNVKKNKTFVVSNGLVYQYINEESQSSNNQQNHPITQLVDAPSSLNINLLNSFEIVFLKNEMVELSNITDSSIASTLKIKKTHSSVIIDAIYPTTTAQMSHSLDADYTLGTLATNSSSKLSYINGQFVIDKKPSVSLTAALDKLTAQILHLRSGTYNLTNTTYIAKNETLGRAFYQSGGTLNLINVTLENFTMGNSGNGGAVYISDGTLNTSATIKNCFAALGGAIFADGGTVNLIGGIICDNTAKLGGGIFVEGGSVSLSGGIVATNLNDTVAGDIYLEKQAYLNIDTELNSSMTIYKNGLTDYLVDNSNTSIVAYSTNQNYLSSAARHLVLTNLLDGADLSYIANSNYLVCQRDIFGLYNPETNERIYTWNQLLYQRMVFVNNGVLYGGDNTMYGNLIISNSVTNIADNAFQGYANLKGVTIPSTVTGIGASAFWECTGLTSITVDPENTTYKSVNNCLIDTASYALMQGCNTSVIPDFISGIWQKAFKGMQGLTEVTIPDSATYIGEFVFDGCINLTNVTIGNNINFIGWEAFRYCIGLTEITIPNSVTNIAGNAFYDCIGLQKLIYDANITEGNFGESNNFKNIGAESATETCELIIGNNVTIVPAYMFSYIETITSIKVGNSVSRICDSAFKGCWSVQTLELPESLRVIEVGAFADCSGITSINIPNGVTQIDGWAFYNNYWATELTIGNTVETIGESAFQMCPNIASVIFPNSLRSLGGNVFNGNTALTSLDLGNGIQSIGWEAFRYCTGLREITIPSSVTEIGNCAFYDCIGLQSLTYNGTIAEKTGDDIFRNIGAESETETCELIIGDDTTIIPAYLFAFIETITSIKLGASVTKICDSGFKGCWSVTNLELSDSLERIEIGAFADCSAITSINIPDSVTFIDGWAFYNNYWATELSLGNSVETIGESAFQMCPNIASVIFPNSLRSLGGNVFNGNTALTSLDLGNGIQSIGWEAFRYCTGLTEITIPSSVTSIGNYAFYDCNKVQRLTYNGSIENSFSGDSNIFKNIGAESETGTCELIIGNNPTMIPAYMFFYVDTITSVTLGNSITRICDSSLKGLNRVTSIEFPSSLESIEIGSMVDCTSLTSITIPDNVTKIEGWAFYNCNNLRSVTIGSSVASIADSAFELCSKVENYDFGSCRTIPRLGPNVFRSIKRSCQIYVPVRLYYSWIEANNWSEWADYIVFNPGLYETDTNNLQLSWSALEEQGKVVVSDTTITSVDKSMSGDLALPNTITDVGDAFSGSEWLTNIILPTSLTTISDGAFKNCTSLRTIRINDGVTHIGEEAFANCIGLTRVQICSKLTRVTIDDSAFIDCSSVLSYDFTSCTMIPLLATDVFVGINGNCKIYVPSNLYDSWITATNWENWKDYIATMPGLYETGTNTLLYSWEQLIAEGKISVDGTTITHVDSSLSGEITIPNTITSVAYGAFSDCTRLTSIVIPASVTTIGDRAFYNCAAVQSLYLNANVSTAYNSNSQVFDDLGRYSETGECRVVIGNNVTAIPAYMFYYSEYITSVVVGTNVIGFGNNSFWGCFRVREVYNLSTLNLVAGNSQWGGVAYYAAVVYNELGESAFVTDLNGYVTYTKDSEVVLVKYTGSNIYLTLPDEITKINRYALYYSENLKSITIPNGVTSIEQYAFGYCRGLTSVTIGNSVANIGDNAFYYCESLTQITIPNSVTKIGGYAFSYCSKLTEVNIPSSVTSMGNNPFSSCSSLTSLTVDSANTSYHSENNCIIKTSTNVLVSGCQNSVIPNYIRTIGYAAFENCDNLTSITIPNTVTRLESQAFYSCDNLVNITIPDSVTYLGWGALGYCNKLNYVVIGSGVSTISSNVFSFNRNSSCLEYIYYKGTAEQWRNIYIESNNSALTADKIYYYNADSCGHEVDGKYWKYNDAGEIEHVGPSVNQWTVTVSPTCQTPGEQQGYCTHCGQTIVMALPLGMHNMVDGVCVICGAEEPNYTKTNDTKYPWVEDSNGVLSSGNMGASNSTSTYTITAIDHMRIIIEYKVSSEQGYDKLSIKNGSVVLVNEISGSTDYVELIIDLAAGNVLTFTYSKDGSVDNGEDKAYIKIKYIGFLSQVVSSLNIELNDLQLDNNLQVIYVKKEDDGEELDVILNKQDDYNTDIPPQANQTASV